MTVPQSLDQFQFPQMYGPAPCTRIRSFLVESSTLADRSGPIEHLQVNGRDIHIVEKHHHVLPAWISAFQDNGAPLCLITLDYHTDLQLAFASYASVQSTKTADPNEMQQISDVRVHGVNINNPASIQAAVDDLRFDQHIDCAHKLGLISDVFVILGREQPGLSKPYAKILYMGSCYPGCPEDWHGDECSVPKANVVIDDCVMNNHVADIAKSFDFEDEPYILDIDLDLFNTRAAISPPSRDQFYRLIRHSKIITVARERNLTESHVTDGGCAVEHGLTVEYLEKKLLEHIDIATSS